MNTMDTARLLPWTGPDGKPCFLLSDGTGCVSRIADRMEAEQLGSAAELIDEARRLLGERSWTPGELHLLAVELTAALVHVHRVAESRGARLTEAGREAPDADEAPDSDGDGPRLPAEAFG
ncbi:hypothetical protein [Streptomyces lydicus]|uniref:hypothetical protein n=1 Tax=Streptomyces lydicus TaxID=47763 RepID=UPI0036A90CEC